MGGNYNQTEETKQTYFRTKKYDNLIFCNVLDIFDDREILGFSFIFSQCENIFHHVKNTIVTSRYRLHAAPKTCVKTKGNLMKKKI